MSVEYRVEAVGTGHIGRVYKLRWRAIHLATKVSIEYRTRCIVWQRREPRIGWDATYTVEIGQCIYDAEEPGA